MTTLTAQSSGDANSSSTWNPTQVPVAGDILLNSSFTVTIPVSVSIPCLSWNTSGGNVVLGAGSQIILDDNVSAGLVGNGIVTATGTQASLARVVSASDPPTNKFQFSPGTFTGIYTQVKNAAGIPLSSNLYLTDSEFCFSPASSPQEYILAGNYSIIRSKYDPRGGTYYIKPTGNMSTDGGFLDGILPTIYSTNYYIPFFDMPKAIESEQEIYVAEHIPVGGKGSHIMTTGYGSRRVTFEGWNGDTNLSNWNHPLGQRWFVSRMKQLFKEPSEIVKITYSQGHYPAAKLISFTKSFADSQPWTGWWHYWATLKEVPYQSST